MTPGTGRRIAYHRFGKAGARPKAYLQAAIHANELPGAMALHHLMPMLVAADKAGRIKGEIIVVPTINPIGQSQLVGNIHLGRYDFLGRENFNRNWLDLADPVAERVGAKLGGECTRQRRHDPQGGACGAGSHETGHRIADAQGRGDEALHRRGHRARPALRHGSRAAPVHFAPGLAGSGAAAGGRPGRRGDPVQRPLPRGADFFRRQRRALGQARPALSCRRDPAGVPVGHRRISRPARRKPSPGRERREQPVPFPGAQGE